MDIRAMCAIGERGQLGHNGTLPWEGDPRPEFTRDVERFFAATRGHVIVAGPRTIASVPDFARVERTFETIRTSDNPSEVVRRYPGRTIFIGGGPDVWSAYASLIRIWDITRLPYDGPADRWFDPKWLVRAGTAIE